MKILIVGCGVAGATFAALVRKEGIGSVTIVEKAPEFRTIGFVIALWGNGRHVLGQLGIDRSVVEKEGHLVSWLLVENKHESLLKAFPIDSFAPFGKTVIIPRSRLHSGLVSFLGDCDVRFGTTVVSIKAIGAKMEAVLSDGTKDVYDLVVGADGVHSSVRDLVFGSEYIHYYGWGVWQYWLPESFAHSRHVKAMLGNGRWCGVFPLDESSVATFMAKVPPGFGKEGNSVEHLRRLFNGFGPTAQKMIDVAEPKRIWYDDLAHVDAPSWYRGRVVLIGDAEHASSPVIGMGASMALEDAYTLAQELKNGGGDIEGALARFNARRAPRIKEYRRVVDKMGRWFMAGGALGFVRNAALPFMPTSYFLGPMKRFLKDGQTIEKTK
jgi:2-polyprenyl-6-methoxyphenol hydroxylase-like FAD-dependent oxidoreductase